MLINEDSYLQHYGVLRRSGRYPWGSGKTQSQRNRSFLDTVAEHRKAGMSESEIAKAYGMSTTDLRATKSIALAEQKQAKIAMAQRLKDKGYSNVAIAKRMNLPGESSVRALTAAGQKDKADILEATSNMLKKEVDKGGYIDVGTGVEHHVGVSRTKLDTAVAVLKEQGYAVHRVQEPQVSNPTNKTTIKVLAPPGTTYRDVVTNMSNIRQIKEYSTDGGRHFGAILPPLSISSKRVQVRYAEDGGGAEDGMIYVRRGKEDISLGGSHYAQVRIAVDGSHYLKGMAVYKDNLPPGVDLVFNTNKSKTGSKLDAMKRLTDDPDNPFGSIVSQIGHRDEHGRITKVTSVMNKVNEEGSWEKWSKNLSSQMLSKQSPALAKQQLDLAYTMRKADLDEIMSLTNPIVKRKLLQTYADNADKAATQLKAYALPRTSNHVILPVNSMKENEVYAPNFRNGERVVLIRYPHGGIFEIPELRVNNKHPEAIRLLGSQTRDAIGINSKVAKRLSGADFDGDTVLVIPNNRGSIKTKPALAGLKDFDPQHAYPHYPGMKVMDARQKQIEMGKVSNLITDMTIKGANDAELARAVRHSMVVIDAEKHKLNYKQSALDNGIASLKEKYQGKTTGGAATIVSRKKRTVEVPERKRTPIIDPKTGRVSYKETGASYVDKRTGKTIVKKSKVNELLDAVDAHKLSSGTLIERVYADHANRMKSLANQARKVMVNTKPIPHSPSAKKAYAKEVAKLNADLNLALRNKPLERQAQLVANGIIRAKVKSNPDMDAAELRKLKSLALIEARNRTGAGKPTIRITKSEWDAIQAGAISNERLSRILDNADLDEVKQFATPRTTKVMTSAKEARARAMLAAGFTQAEVADHLGVSLTTLKTTIA